MTIATLPAIAGSEFANSVDHDSRHLGTTLVVIDASVEDYQMLADGVVDGAQVVILERDRDGVEQLTEAIHQYNNLSQLHIVTHGAPGCLYLGNTELSLLTLEKYELHLMSWSLAHYSSPLSICLYGCSVAAGRSGSTLIRKLHELTGASIAASSTAIGSATQGGNWELDSFIPSCDRSIFSSPFTPLTLASYSGILAAGDLDLGFGGNGTGSVVTSGAWGASAAQDVIVQPDGKILVIGWAGTVINVPNFTIVRYNPDGTLDFSYGGGDGVVSLNVPFYVPGSSGFSSEFNPDLAYSGFLQADGSLLVAGSAQLPFQNYNMAVARLAPNGALDTNFGTNGIATLGFGDNLGEARSILADPSGRIWVIGSAAAVGGGASSFGNFVIARYTQIGQLDTTFGNGTGIVQTDINGGRDEAYSATFLPDARLLVTGRAFNPANNTYDLTLVVYNESGNLDTSFGGIGRVVTDFTPSNQTTAWNDVAYKVEVYNDKIWVVGASSAPSGDTSPRLAIARYNLDGTPDLNFGDNGKVLDLPNFSAESARDIVFQPDGKFLVAVEVPNGNPTLVRFNANGTLDTTFGGGDGIAIAPDTAGNNLYSSYAVALQTIDGEIKAVLVGSAAGGFSVARFDLGTSVNRPPVAVDDAITLNEDDIATFNVLSNDSDPDNDPLTLAAVNLNGLDDILTSNGNGNFTFNPGSRFQSLASGQEASAAFSYTISDARGGSASATANLTITGVNDAPIVVDDLLTTIEGQALTINAATLLQNDSDVDTGDRLGLQAVGNATNGTVVLDENGNVVFTPTSGFSGTATFEYTVRDTDNATSTGMVSITVNGVNDAPVNTVPGSQTVNANTALIFSGANGNRISIADVDAGTNPVEVTLTASNGTLTLSGTNGLTVTNGSNGTASLTVRGTLTDINSALEGLSFNPTAGYAGNARIQIATNDLGNTGFGNALSDTDLINIAVESVPLNLPPTNISLSSNRIAENQPANTAIATLSTTDPDTNDTHTYSLVSGAGDTDNSLFVIDGNVLRATQPFNFETKNSYSLRLRTTDNNGSTFEKAFTIDVLNVNEAPQNSVPSLAQTTEANTAIVFSTANGNRISIADVDAGTNPVEVTLTASNGTLTLSGTNGLTVTNGSNGTASLTVRGTLTDINSALEGLSFNPTAGYAGNARIQIATNDLGNTGFGNALSDTDLININVNSVNNLLSGAGGQKTFSVQRGQTLTITDFGGVGRGSNPSQATIAEVDTIQFIGTDLLARNMLLTQVDSNLEITFAGISDTKVVLQDFALENLENLVRATRAKVDLGNILFDGQTRIQNSFDVIDADQILGTVFNRNTVTFLNDRNNNVKGLNRSNDVINGQDGDDRLSGLSGNDWLRGEIGDDILNGGAGNDILVGGEGQDYFVFDSGKKFATGSLGSDSITDFEVGTDKIILGRKTFSKLNSPIGGQLATSDFAIVNDPSNGSVGNLSARIIYNQGTGDLLYNPDGAIAGLSGGGRFATLTGTPPLSANDFLVQ